MYNQNLYYQNYYPNYNTPYNNRGFYFAPPYTAFYQPYTQNLPHYQNYNNTKDSKVTDIDTLESTSNLQNSNIQNDDKQDDRLKNKRKENFKLGPIDISKERISIFGFDIAIDDLILITLIIFLFFETDCDYSILIVLGLMLFNISFSSLDLF